MNELIKSINKAYPMADPNLPLIFPAIAIAPSKPNIAPEAPAEGVKSATHYFDVRSLRHNTFIF